MLTYPQIDPVAIHIGPISIHWYGLMYLVGFFGAWAALRLRLNTGKYSFTPEQLSDILFYAALGVIIGGRLGYMVFYDWNNLIHHPSRILMVWQGGMSFHGGFLGVFIALWIYAHKIHKSVGDIGDFIVPAVPIGLAVGRIGNFINGELWGRVTDVPWAMIFPNAGDLPRHPSQLYEFFLEGIVMFAVLWWYSSKPRPRWAVSGLFITLYGLFRFSVEFFRDPDPQIGYLVFDLTKGQLLSLPMFLAGIIMMVYAYKKRKQTCSNI